MDISLLELLALVALVGGGVYAWRQAHHLLYTQSIPVQIGIVAALSVVTTLLWGGNFTRDITLFAALVGGYWAFVGWKSGAFRMGQAKDNDVIRGNQLADPKDVLKMVKKEEATVYIGGIPIPRRLEISHFLLSGTTRTGKSQCYLSMMSAIRARGERCLVADVGGEFTARFYRDGKDICLNPFDQRGVAWSPLAEMRSAWDAEKIAKSMIPEAPGDTDPWNGYAQTLLSAVLTRAWENDANNAEVLHLMTRATHAELKEYIAGLPAEGLFGDGNERMLASVIGTASSYVKPLQYLDPETGCSGFSIRNWISAEEGDSWIFFSFTDGQFASLRPIISASLDIAISATLELIPNPSRAAKGLPERRIWFMLDELASFGRLGSLRAMLEKGAKYGAPVVAGLQAPLSQLREHYGRDVAQTLLANLGTQLVLRAPDAESAEYLSQIFGEQDIRRINHSTSHSDGGVSVSQSMQYTTQRVIMPAEIQQLPNLVGYLNIVGDIPPCVIQIPVVPGEEIAERFVQKKRLTRSKSLLIADEPAPETIK